jgi:hypothetical protein
MADDHKLVPFGKYKGQPVAVLQQDREYCEWLTSQDWFRARYTTIHTLIINRFGEPSETPEHNALQAKFLDKTWRERFLTVRTDCQALTKQINGTWKALQENRIECLAATRAVHAEESQIAAQPGLNEWRVNAARQRAQQMAAAIEWLESDLASITGRCDHFGWRSSSCRFEVAGVDVIVEAEYGALHQKAAVIELFMVTAGRLRECDLFVTRAVRDQIECKPTLGDDYPAVLRQMRAAECDTLVIGSYTGVGATFEQVQQIFGDIKVLTVAEIEACGQ